MSHENNTRVYRNEDERMYRIPNQELGLGTHDNMIGRMRPGEHGNLQPGEYDPKEEYELSDTDGTPYHAVLTGLVELNQHRTIDSGSDDPASDALVQVSITQRVRRDKDGNLYNALGAKWVRQGDLVTLAEAAKVRAVQEGTEHQNERIIDSRVAAKLGSTALSGVDDVYGVRESAAIEQLSDDRISA